MGTDTAHGKATSPLSELSGTPFFKMTGSGNDFVIFDGREVARNLVTSPDAVVAICNRHNGIGADGVVYLDAGGDGVDGRINYFNSDGTPADLCGNATLCSTAIAAQCGLGRSEGMRLMTDAGLIAGRLVGGMPEIQLAPVTDVRKEAGVECTAAEIRIGFVLAGVAHLVVLCQDVEMVELDTRGHELRWHSSSGPAGANVNFVSLGADRRWRYRTFERGVEGETLACGTGAVAVAILLVEWGLTSDPVRLVTSSERILTIGLARTADSESGWIPTLRGEGRVVFRGAIGQLIGANQQG